MASALRRAAAFALAVRQQTIPVSATHAQNIAVFKENLEVSVPERLDFFDLVDADYRRTADSGEPPWIEPFLEVANRHSQ